MTLELRARDGGIRTIEVDVPDFAAALHYIAKLFPNGPWAGADVRRVK